MGAALAVIRDLLAYMHTPPVDPGQCSKSSTRCHPCSGRRSFGISI
jgi:hypothetical protein